jgi:hypothetical protein
MTVSLTGSMAALAEWMGPRVSESELADKDKKEDKKGKQK